MKANPLSLRPGIAFALLITALSGSAFGQGTEQQRSDCMGDAFRFCSAQIPDVAAIEACLKAKEAELTPACQAEFRPAGRTRLQRAHFRT